MRPIYGLNFCDRTEKERDSLGRHTDLKKGLGSCNLFFARANIWSQGHFDRQWDYLTALDQRSEDYECKTYNPCCYPSHPYFIDTFTNWGLIAKWSHQDGRRKFRGLENETIF